MAATAGFMRREDILRYPQLYTILMVEDFIKKNDGCYKRRELWESLPKKISIDSEGKIGWIYYPELANQYFNQKE